MVGRRAKALLVAVALCALYVIGVPAATAAYVEVGSFAGGGSGSGGSGSGNGELSNPGQADVYDATGNLYVADTGNDRVQVFKPNATGGEYDSQAALPGAAGLAIDQASGHVYVATGSGIAKLTSALAPAGGWSDPGVSGPLAVDPSTGDLLVADTAGNLIRRYNSDGTADGSFAAERPVDLAANSAGDVFVVTTTGDIASGPCGSSSAVERFSGAGVSEGQLAGPTVPGAVAVDPDDDSILVATHVNEYFCEQGNRPGVSSFDAGGNFEGAVALGADTIYAAVPGLAARGDGVARVYAVTKSPVNDAFGATKVTVLEVPPPTAPEVLGQTALRGSTDATLRAQVSAGGAATEYHFEYGPTSAYGEQTAVESLPASFEATFVSAEISGLDPGTTYHYRVVAENSLGETPGPDRTFTTVEAGADGCPNEAFRADASYLTDCRAFELVTPVGSDADIRIVGGPVTPDGDTVCFASEDSMAGSAPNGMKNADDGFCAWRTPSGWETKWVTGPASPNPGAFALGSNVYFVSPDGQRAVFATDGVLFGNDYLPPPGTENGSNQSAYMWEAGETTWLAPAGPGPHPSLDGLTTQRRPLAVSEDLTRGIFQSTFRILPEDENNDADIYEWSPGGLRLVTSDASGKAVGGEAGFQPVTFDETLGVFDSGTSSQQAAAPGAMSDDGSRVFFQHYGAPLDGDTTEAPEGDDPESPFPIQSVYMREGDEVTLISPRLGSGPNLGVYFVGATADGEHAYLETAQQLTPDAKQPGRAIYRYDVATEELALVADAAPIGVKFLTLSDDGSTILYRDRSTDELIVEREGVATTLGKFATADIETEQGAGNARADQRMLRVSPDGRVVVVAAAGEFAGFGPGLIQVYRWEAGEGLERISALEGSEPEQKATIGAFADLVGDRTEFFYNHNGKANSGAVMSDDGSRVFFETAEALVKRDVNDVTDVYEWRDGEVNIVSTGTGGKALYHGNSADGGTVFISTFDRLLPQWDRNGKRDLYAVTPNGGYAPPAPPPACAGEGCQPKQAAPPPTTPGKAAGDGNLGRGLGKAALGKGGKSVRVGVLVPGKVTATLTAKLGKGKAITVAKASRTAKQAGALVLPLKLSGKAKRALAERGRLAVTLTVTHLQSDQAITRKVTLHG